MAAHTSARHTPSVLDSLLLQRNSTSNQHFFAGFRHISPRYIVIVVFFVKVFPEIAFPAPYPLQVELHCGERSCIQVKGEVKEDSWIWTPSETLRSEQTDTMWHPCCQNVLGEKALKSIIWQQHLLSRGGKQTAAPPLSDTRGGSNGIPLIPEAHICVRCCLFVACGWMRICHLWHGLETVLYRFKTPIQHVTGHLYGDGIICVLWRHRNSSNERPNCSLLCNYKADASSWLPLCCLTTDATKHPESWTVKWVFLLADLLSIKTGCRLCIPKAA